MSIEFNTVPASQIMPVSGSATILSMGNFRKELEEHFFKKSLVAYKTFKNSYTSSAGTNKSKLDFLQSYVKVLEDMILLNEANATPEKKIIIKDVFNIIRYNCSILINSGVDFEVDTFFASLAGYLASKLK